MRRDRRQVVGSSRAIWRATLGLLEVYWLARKYHQGFRQLLPRYVRAPQSGQATTWVLQGRNGEGRFVTIALKRLVATPKGRFLWRTSVGNPYLPTLVDRPVRRHESRYADVAFALSDT